MGEVSLYIDDGHGNRFAYKAETRKPIASTLKILHLVAFAEAASQGRIGVLDAFPLAAWDRHYLPGTDGGARLRAFEALGIRSAGELAAEPDRLIPVLQLVKAMISFSDNSSTDFLHDLLRPTFIKRVSASYGWPDPDLRSLLGELLLLVMEGPLPDLSSQERCAHGHELRKRYFIDKSFRHRVQEQVPAMVCPSAYAKQASWAVGGPAATVREIANLMNAVAQGAVSGEGPQRVAQRYLEAQSPWVPTPGLSGIGIKSGVLPGVLSSAVNVRWSDGRTGVAVAVVSGMTQAGHASAVRSGSLLALLKMVLTDERWTHRLIEELKLAGRGEDPTPGSTNGESDVRR